MVKNSYNFLADEPNGNPNIHLLMDGRVLKTTNYKLCRNRVQAQIKKCKSQYFKDLLKDSLNSPDKFWKAIKSVLIQQG